MFGGNKETAEKVYKESNYSYINAVIEWYERASKLNFLMIKEGEKRNEKQNS